MPRQAGCSPDQTGTLANLLAQLWRSAAGLLERALIFTMVMLL